jgi:hypothetical protein
MVPIGESRSFYHKKIHVRQATAELTAYEINVGFGCTWKCDCGECSVCQIGAPTLDAVLNFAGQNFAGHCNRQHPLETP